MNAASPVLVALEVSVKEAIVEDVSRIIQCAPFIARYPNRLFDPGLISELAEAVDILTAKVGALQEAEGEDR
jgi:hypothetical protein